MDMVTELRRATLTRLKSQPDFTAIIPAASIFGQSTPPEPTWPFVKTGVPIGAPLDTSCMNGATVRWTLHAFAKARYDSNRAMVETAEDHIGRIVAGLKNVLHRTPLPIPGGVAKLKLINDQRQQYGGEADAYHAIVEFRAKVMAA